MDSALHRLRASAAAQQFDKDWNPEPKAPRQQVAYLDNRTKESMLSYMARQGLGTLATVGRALDTPGAIFRGVLAGDPLSGFSWDDDRRVTGEELLKQYGLLKKDADPFYSTAAGLATEIALDPFGILKMPLQALTKAGRAAKAAGILDKASDAYVAKTGFDAAAEAAKNTATGRGARKFLEDILPGGKGLNPENVKYRPLTGPRVARTKVSIEDTLNSLPEAERAIAKQKVLDYLKVKGLDYDAIKNEKLGGAFGLGYFNLVDPIIFNPKGAEKYLDALDAMGQSARWSTPARLVSQFASKSVDGAFKAGDQLANMRQFDNVTAAQAAAQREVADHLLMAKNIELPDEAQKILGTDSLTGEEGRRFVRRFMEGTQTQSDMRLRDIIGPEAIDGLVGNWERIKADTFDKASALGMRAAKTQDKYGVLNSPRKALELDFGEYGSGSGRRSFSARTMENEFRNPLLLSPGGTDDLEEASLLPIVQKFLSEGREGQLSVTEVAKKVKEFIDAKHGPGAVDPRVRPFKTFVPQLGADGKPLMQQAVDAAGNPKMITARTKRGNIIIDKATGQPKQIPKMTTVKSPSEVITMNQAEAMVRAMMRRRDDLPANIGLFSEHPLKAQARTMVNQAGARANAQHVYESVGEAAIGTNGLANTIPGTRFKPVDKAMDELARDLGLATQGGQFASKQVIASVRQAIAKANNIADPSTVDLSRYALPEEVFDRLRRTRDFYSSARAQKDVENLFDAATTLFKGFALAAPATKVRDFYGNTFLVWTQVGNAMDVGAGMWSASRVLAGKLDEAADSLRKIPSYSNLTPAELEKAVARDVAGTGILRSLSSNDLISSNRSAQLNQFVPGMEPIRLGDWARELIPDGSRSISQMLADQTQFKGIRLPWQKTAAFETKNAMLNASQKASDWTDSVARLGGMFSLMRQGVSAEEAAKRITSALVDYSSLTTWERNTARRAFLWWSFQSRIGKYVAQQLLFNPGGGYAQTIRGFNTLQRSDDDVYIPQALRQQFAFRVPEAVKPYLGIDPSKTDTTTFLKDIDIPGFDVLSLFDAGSPTALGKAKGTAFNLMQQAHPLSRTMYELASGNDSFSRRPLEQAVTPLDRLYMRASGSKTPMNALARQAINLLPGPQQRLLPLFGGLADQRIPFGQRVAKQAFNSLAGMKLQDVDPAWQLQDARRVLADELGGFMQDYTESYIPEEVLPQLPAELMPQYQLFRTLGRDLRKARK